MLSDRQREIIIGTLLGDGAMRCKRNALLEVNHCAAQRVYVDWKHEELASLVRTPPKPRNTNGSRTAYRFTTISSPLLTPIYHAFYRNSSKTIPHDLTLSPLALAVWFMDDGSRSRSSVYFNSQQFSNEGQLMLIRMLHEQFGFKAAINRDKSYFRIRLATASAVRLASVIRPYIIPEMAYKLPHASWPD